MIVKGIQTSIAKKPYIFVIFQGVSWLIASISLEQRLCPTKVVGNKMYH